MKPWQGLLLAWIAGLGLVACETAPVHEGEAFSAEAPFQRRIPAQVDQVCEAARLTLLSQGYAVDDGRAKYLKGSKAFQPDEDVHSTLDFHVVCAHTRNGATLYANAVESKYELKKARQAAGISIPSVGSINLPWGSSTESLVKVAEETVTDATFYERFFNLVEQHLGINTRQRQE